MFELIFGGGFAACKIYYVIIQFFLHPASFSFGSIYLRQVFALLLITPQPESTIQHIASVPVKGATAPLF